MLQKYETHDLTDNQLTESYWIVTHWKKIELAITRVLIVLNVILILFSLGFAVKMYLIDHGATKAFIGSLKASVGGGAGVASVQQLTVDSVSVLSRGDGKVDVVSRVTNPNASFRAGFELVFMAGGSEVGRSQSFLYPGETRYVLGLSLPFSGTASEMTASPVNLFWQRMVPSDTRLIAERKTFRVDDFVFSSESGVSRATFTVANTGVHNFWSVRVPVVLLSGSDVIAATMVTLDHLDSGEKKKVQTDWYQTISQPSSYVIEPEVDVFDDSAYRTKKAPLQKLR